MKSNYTIKSLINPLKVLNTLYRSRDLLWQISKRNITMRYRGSLLNLLWMFATPLLMLAVYTFVFTVIFKSRWGEDIGGSKVTFALILFCGLSVFNMFSESLNHSVNIIIQNPNYVNKVVFPLEVLPMAAVLSSFFMGIIWLFILLAAIVLVTHTLSVAIVCLPLLLFSLFLCTCGIAWLVASLGVYIRDTTHVIGLLLQMLFFMTPIFYPLEMVPAPFSMILRLNPLTDIVQNVRSVIIYHQWPNWMSVGMWMVCSYVIFHLGYIWFMKTKRGFADVL